MIKLSYDELVDFFKRIDEKIQSKMKTLFESSFKKLTMSVFVSKYDETSQLYKFLRNSIKEPSNMFVGVAYQPISINYKLFGTFNQQVNGIDKRSISIFNDTVKNLYVSKMYDVLKEVVNEEKLPIEILISENFDDEGFKIEDIFISINSDNIDNVESFLSAESHKLASSGKPIEKLTIMSKSVENDEKTSSLDKTCDIEPIDLNTLNFTPFIPEISVDKNGDFPFDSINPVLSKLLTGTVKNIIDSAVESVKKECIGTWKNFKLPTVEDILNESLGIEKTINAKFKKMMVTGNTSFPQSNVNKLPNVCGTTIIKRPVKCILFGTPCIMIIDEVLLSKGKYYTISEGYVIFTFDKNEVPTIGYIKILCNSSEDLKISIDNIQTLSSFAIKEMNLEEDECCKAIFEIATLDMKNEETPKYSRLYPDEIQKDIREICQALKGFIYGAFRIFPEIPGDKTKFLKSEKYIVLCQYKDSFNPKEFKNGKDEIYNNAFKLLLEQTITFEKFEVITNPETNISQIIGTVRDDRRQ